MTAETATTDRSEAARTPLHDLHVELGGRMVTFAGWSLPVQYPAGIMAEHRQCRTAAALFDVSHMGQVRIRGDRAAVAFETIVPGGISTLKPGRLRYTLFTNDRGGVLDDLIVGMMDSAGDHLFVVVNAGCRAADIRHMRATLEPGCEVQELTDRGLIALQGPQAATVIGRLAPDAAALPFMAADEFQLAGHAVRISRCGYTGEDGFEISVAAADAEALARALLAAPEVAPAGLGARDSLRLEAGLCLYGHELSEDISPIEAGLNWAIPKRRREAADFPGAPTILQQFERGPERKLVGICPSGRAPAREGTAIQAPGSDGAVIGTVTSGGFGPTFGAPVALGYVAAAYATPGAAVDLMIRGKPHPAQVAALPFVPHQYVR